MPAFGIGSVLRSAAAAVFAGANLSKESQPSPVLAVRPRPTVEDNETTWSKYIAQQWGAEAEARLPTGARIDVLTDAFACEVEWCKGGKVYEAVGQTLYYRRASNRKHGVVVLLMGKGSRVAEYLWYERCLVACSEAGLAVVTVDVSDEQDIPRCPSFLTNY